MVNLIYQSGVGAPPCLHHASKDFADFSFRPLSFSSLVCCSSKPAHAYHTCKHLCISNSLAFHFYAQSPTHSKITVVCFSGQLSLSALLLQSRCFCGKQLYTSLSSGVCRLLEWFSNNAKMPIGSSCLLQEVCDMPGSYGRESTGVR